ncbi:hypothetical protein [Neisseria sp. Ec49-e6-T10]|uniref:hypothetical protein n=1 Tax=Neisseria sp. Ec49-e6-T10 TaxID=3140744 RepID=UPI003EBC91AD
MMKKLTISVVLLGFLSMTGVLYAQTNSTQSGNNNPNADWGWCGGGMGHGYGHGGKMWSNHSNRHRGGYMHQGTNLMTQEEFISHRDKLYSAKNYNDCKLIQKEYHNNMVKRAKEQGVTVPNNPPAFGFCERLNDRGYFNKK